MTSPGKKLTKLINSCPVNLHIFKWFNLFAYMPVFRFETCYQIALAIKDEVEDLEKAGINVIQIDEAALREGLPLRKSEQDFYLKWAVHSFRITNCCVQDTTQVHFCLFSPPIICYSSCVYALYLNSCSSSAYTSHIYVILTKC